jgi:hypothetical protein
VVFVYCTFLPIWVPNVIHKIKFSNNVNKFKFGVSVISMVPLGVPFIWVNLHKVYLKSGKFLFPVNALTILHSVIFLQLLGISSLLCLHCY